MKINPIPKFKNIPETSNIYKTIDNFENSMFKLKGELEYSKFKMIIDYIKKVLGLQTGYLKKEKIKENLFKELKKLFKDLENLKKFLEKIKNEYENNFKITNMEIDNFKKLKQSHIINNNQKEINNINYSIEILENNKKIIYTNLNTINNSKKIYEKIKKNINGIYTDYITIYLIDSVINSNMEIKKYNKKIKTLYYDINKLKNIFKS